MNASWSEGLTAALLWMQGAGWMGWVLFVLCYAFACVTLLPGSVLTLGAGAIYGIGWGLLLVSIGSSLGATLSFLLGRYLFRGWLQKRFEHNARFQSLDAAVKKEGWKIVFLTRLSPLFPFSFVNYALGLTRIPLWQFALTSCVGVLPLTTAYIYAGSLMGDAVLRGQRMTELPGGWWLRGAGLVATVIVVIFVTRMATRALREKTAG